MKPVFQKLTAEPAEGFVFKDWHARSYECPWHFHPEYELIFMREGGGYRVVGDNVSALVPGDMVFLGPMVPHIWQDDRHAGPVHQLLLQFETKSFGEPFFALPAMAPVRRLLERSTRGLHIVGRTRAAVGSLLQRLMTLDGLPRLLCFWEILGRMADAPADCRPIASVTFVARPNHYDEAIMNRVFEILNGESGDQIRLPDAASRVGMSEGAFSRFFRLHTGKTFPEFRNELRVGRACRMLSEDERTITDIAYACGFTNLSNFNRQFLRMKGVSPRQFRNEIRQKLAEVPG